MKIALAQMKMSNSLQYNLSQTLSWMAQASNARADLICFPEVQLSPFFPKFHNHDPNEYLSSIQDDPIVKIMEKCKEFGIMAVPNLYLKEKDHCFDASPFIDMDGRILGVSKMVHIMQGENFYEQDYYTPSDDGFKVFDTPFGKIGVVICFDRHLPESIRTCTLKGADLIIIPTANLKSEPMEMFEWEIRVQAMQNSVFIAMCNRTGVEDHLEFAGQSLVADPYGDLIGKLDDREQVLYAEIDLSRSRKIRDEKPYMKLRRPEMYL